MIRRTLRATVLVSVLLALAATTTRAQETVLALEPSAGVLQQAGEKSPALAGILSFFIPYGTGSFYAGDNQHGVRHLVIGGVTLVGLGIGFVAACDAPGNVVVCDEDDPAFVIGSIFALGWAVNWIWGTIVAVNDAHRYNRGVRGAALLLPPALEPLTVSGVAASGIASGRLGVRLIQVTF